ncbi:hypothetical protein SFUL_3748 [Streptomyces microflavus DSM 40593]|uniref:Uncharacterized protein n=1 Tax=Streptomyces microflavus DSM 40593 TaxID=1303692 RepID=N0CR56_STRMI|nr:hypothetical protein [Streptomyces microflavus]AGK78666.1 hypothetical protein SFUL_3748 [Streptomyces microflavus DSM 40593]
MNAPIQHDEVRKVYITCRLGKGELERLFNLAPEGIPAASVSVSTQRNSTRYSAAKLSDLIDHVRNSNTTGNLEDWENLALEAADSTGDRKVSVAIDTERVEIQVSGQDATWVHGQAARIELFLKASGGKPRRDREEKTRRIKLTLLMYALAIPYMAAMLISLMIVDPQAFESQEGRESWRGILAILGSSAMMLFVYWCGFKLFNRANRALLKPTDEIPHGSWWSRSTSTDKIALGSLIVAVLSAGVAVVTLGKELAK